MRLIKGLQIALLVILFFSCRKPYNPEVTTINSNVLIVEGFINIGSDSTIIKLSRTQLISDETKNKPEVGAVVTVESDANDKYILPEKGQGKYVSPGLNLSSAKKYRLSIKTSKGVNYLSDYVEAKITPLMDSINYEVKQNGVQLYVNTHDNNENSKYYKWDYTETWEFYASFYSVLIWRDGDVRDRDMVNNNIYRCWASDNNHPISLASSAKLEKDVIFNKPLAFVNSDSEKISFKYSILVRQFVLTKEAYEFWENLKKNTESLGSIFDAQPSQISGNIHNVANASEPVVGYVSVGTYNEKRLFIARNELPTWETSFPYRCISPDTVLRPDYRTAFEFGNNIPLQEFEKDDGQVVMLSAPKPCADCTIRGVNKRPEFWQ